ARRRPHLVCISGAEIGRAYRLGDSVVLGRSESCDIHLQNEGVSRVHARVIVNDDAVSVEDLGSSNGTLLNGRKLKTAAVLADGDKVQIGTTAVFRFALLDEMDEQYQQVVRVAVAGSLRSPIVTRARGWTATSWQTKPAAQNVTYEDAAVLENVL